MKKEDAARRNFTDGYNCCQSVVLAFADEIGIDKDVLMRMSSSFGGGMGRTRELCGAVSGIAFVTGALYGYSSADDIEGKTAHYARLQELAAAFKRRFGSTVCRDLLGLDKDEKLSPVPDARTPQYYHSRSCEDFVGYAASLIEQFIEKREEQL